MAERFVDPRTLQANPGVIRTQANDARAFFDNAQRVQDNEGLTRLTAALGGIGDTLGDRRAEESRHKRAEERQLADKLSQVRAKLQAGEIDSDAVVALDPEQGFPGLYREDAKGRQVARTFDETLKQEYQEQNLAALDRDAFEQHLNRRFKEAIEANRGGSDVFFGAIEEGYQSTREELLRQHDAMKRQMAQEDNLLTFKSQVGGVIDDAAHAGWSAEFTAQKLNDEIALSGKLFAVSNADRVAAIMASLREDIEDRGGSTAFAEEVAERLGFVDTPEFQAVLNAAEDRAIRDQIDQLQLQNALDSRRERVLTEQVVDFARKGESPPPELLDQLRTLDPFIDERLGNYRRNIQTNAWNSPESAGPRSSVYEGAYDGSLTQTKLSKLELEYGIPAQEAADIRRIIDNRDEALNSPSARSIDNYLQGRFQSRLTAQQFGVDSFLNDDIVKEAVANLDDQLTAAGIEFSGRARSDYERWLIDNHGSASDKEKVDARDRIVREHQVAFDKLVSEQKAALKEQLKRVDDGSGFTPTIPNLSELPGTGVEPVGRPESRAARVRRLQEQSAIRLDTMPIPMQDTVLTMWDMAAQSKDPTISDPALRASTRTAEKALEWIAAIRAGQDIPASAQREYEEFLRRNPNAAGLTPEQFIRATYDVFFAASRKR